MVGFVICGGATQFSMLYNYTNDKLFSSFWVKDNIHKMLFSSFWVKDNIHKMWCTLTPQNVVYINLLATITICGGNFRRYWRQLQKVLTLDIGLKCMRSKIEMHTFN